MHIFNFENLLVIIQQNQNIFSVEEAFWINNLAIF